MAQQSFCPRCGVPVATDRATCPSCGASLKPMRPPPPPRKPEPTPTPTPPPSPPREPTAPRQAPGAQLQQPPPEAMQTRCPNCGSSVAVGTKYCPQCGFNLEAGARRLSEKAAPKPRVSYYSREKRFFSFEGYELEGVPGLALLLIVWGAWNFAVAGFTFARQILVWLPTIPLQPEPGQDIFDPHLIPGTGIPIPAVFSTLLGALLILTAFGLLLVKTPAFYSGLVIALLLIPLSAYQLVMALTITITGDYATGAHKIDNVLTGIIGMLISSTTLLQFVRIRKYFVGGLES